MLCGLCGVARTPLQPSTSTFRVCMSELRQDPVSQRWVIIAQDRENRPNEFVTVPTERIASQCPFCAGNESATPEAVAIYTTGHSQPHIGQPSTWQVRVVPNKYPAVRSD